MVDTTTQPLALLGGRFYSMGVSSPIVTIGSKLSGPIFHMVDATHYATLRASDPNPCPTLAIVFFVVAHPSLGPGLR
jgi:ABC-2 type transport system permease protein